MRLFSFVAAALLVCAVQAQDLAGSWQGKLETPGGTLRLRLNIKGDASGWKATLDSLDQGANGIPVPDFSFAEGKVRWAIPAISASYEGSVKGEVMEGEFKQGATLPLTLKRLAADAPELAPPKRPQTPKPPFPYKAEEVTFASKASGVRLGGTLTMPNGAGPFPALVLVSGSGPQDRDETEFDHKPFAVTADYLARRGIAVLRYDDRGVGKSGGSSKDATSADFADDAEGAFDYLRKRDGIGKAGIGGHSEGGVIAPMVAARRAEVAFVVMLAGAGVGGEQVLDAQGAAIRKAMGVPAEAIEANRAVMEALYAVIRKGGTDDDVLAEARSKMGDTPAARQSAQFLSSKWMRAFLAYDPAVTLEKVKCPVLVLNGELDLQVLADQNVPAIESALRKGGNTRVTVKRFPKLNHLFQTASTGAPAEYAKIEETIAPVVLETMAEWLAGVAKSEAR